MPKRNKLINREIGWLLFNDRVLQEAEDSNVPLIERIRFLGIFSNNLDEFFKVRVATLKRMIDIGKTDKSVTNENPRKVLNKIQVTVIAQQEKFDQVFKQLIIELEKENIFIITEKNLNPVHVEFLKNYFEENVLPILSPVMLNNLENFPYMKDKSIYFGVKLLNTNQKTKPEFALIEIPTAELPRFIQLPSIGANKYIILLDDVIRYFLSDVFHIFHFNYFEAFTIKITRDAELDIDNDLSVSFLEKISKSVRDRNKGQPVRFVYDSAISKDLLKYLFTRMNMDSDDNLIPGGRYHNFKDFMKFPNIGGSHLEYPPAPPLNYHLIKPGSRIIDVIKKKDLLLHFPYQKFSYFINFLREASIDPGVKAIKITIYRVAKNSKVINALINAARNGKDVTVNIELQARFDENSNIYWARKLEEVGAKVFFGVKGLKVHSKLVLISRLENNKIIDYACIGTGNFHEGNASVYSDLFFFTSDKRITKEVDKIFDFFENTYKTFSFRYLMVSPLYMRNRLYRLIDGEINNALAGKDAWIILKINNLIDQDISKKLIQANNSGVKIKLLIRGICSIVPGIPGISENIEVISIIDRYLEHSRVLIFCNDNNNLYYIASADWMTRNLDHRVEVACPIYDPVIQKELRLIIDTQLRDNTKARIIDTGLNNVYKEINDDQEIRSQVELYNYYKNMA